MKILEVIPNLHCGGAEKVVVELSNEFVRQGHSCEIVTLYDLSSGDMLRELLNKRVKIYSLGKRLGLDFRCLFRLFRYVYLEKPDVVHVHTGGVTYVFLSAILYRNCRYFSTIHSDAKRDAGGGIHTLIRKILYKSKIVVPITISEETEKSFQKMYGTSGYLIFNGCSNYKNLVTNDFTDFRRDVDFLLVHVGSIQPVKNQLALVKAFCKLLEDGVRARLLMLGRISDEDTYNMLKSYFSENIIYLGECLDSRFYMSRCDAFCLSSTMEGMPITIIEAFSVGCIPIVTPVGGCINMVKDGYNGILAASSSKEAIYEALRRFVGLNKEQKRTISNNARSTYCTDYSIKKTADEYMKIFTSH